MEKRLNSGAEKDILNTKRQPMVRLQTKCSLHEEAGRHTTTKERCSWGRGPPLHHTPLAQRMPTPSPTPRAQTQSRGLQFPWSWV